MRYVKNNQVFTIQQIRQEFPLMSIPNDADLSSFGYAFLVQTPMPEIEGYYAKETAPIDNVQQWELIPLPVVVPQSITARQARLVLLQADLLDNVEATLNTNRAWQIEWEYASEIERSHTLIVAMQQALNLTDEQVDNLFINGAKL